MKAAHAAAQDLPALAAVLVQCRTCGHQWMYDRELLGEHLRCHGGVPAWSMLARALPCRCRSTDLSIKPLPYAREIRDPELRAYQRVLIELAVSILDEAGEHISNAKADTVAVRLALRVLVPHVVHRGVLVSLWQSGCTDNPLVRGEGYRATLGGVRRQLRVMSRL